MRMLASAVSVESLLMPSFRSLTALFCVLALAFCPTPGSAQVPASTLVSQVNIPYSQFTLKNGLRVIVHYRSQGADRGCLDLVWSRLEA
jgi:hypothetical protein